MKKTIFIQHIPHPIQSMRKNNRYEYRFLGLLVGLFFLVLLSGVLIYNQLNNIANEVSIDRTPEKSLIFMKDIRNDLVVADNKVNAYSLSQQDTFLFDYYRTVNRTYDRVNQLKTAGENSYISEFDILSLERLVKKKFEILDTLLNLQNHFRVNEVMNKVVNELSAAKKVDSKEEVSQMAEQEEKRTFKDRLFGKNKPETKVLPATPRSTNLDLLNKEIIALKDKESKKESTTNATELYFQSKNKSVVLEIGYVLSRIEKAILNELEKQTVKAKESAVQLSNFLIVFSILVASLIGLTLYSIFKYLKSNDQTQKELKKAKAQADELAATKERFLANMSHEIRTPLNAISGFAQLLSKEKMPDYQKEKVNIINKSSQHLIQIINHILDLTKLQNNKMNVETTSFSIREEIELVKAILMEESAKQKNQFEVRVEEYVPDCLIGDPMKIRQILLNLCSNAIKFTENGLIQLNIQATIDSDHLVQLRMKVEDEGIGIPKNKQETIFNEFEQAESSTHRKYGGTGLGLAITKKLVDLLHGTIQLKSEEGVGTKIVVNIPVEQSIEQQGVERKEIQQPFKYLSGKNVLIVDDEPFNRKLLATLMHQNNVYTDEATNGKEAVNMVKNNQYDWVFMDIRMPEMDGIQATKIIRSELGFGKEKTCIVALTANSQMLSEEERVESGFDACIEKPFSEEKLIQLLLAKEVKVVEPTNTTLNYSLDNLKELSSGDNDFYQEMVETFLHSTQQSMEEMEQALEQGSLIKVGDLAHKMCSPCAHLEAIKLHEMLREIEDLCRTDKSKKTIKKLVKELRIFVDELLNEMSEETGIALTEH